MLALYQGRYSGLGTNLIDMSFHNETIYFYDWLLKLLLTVLTISVGFLGGEVTPLFTIGATLGIVLAHLLGLPLVFVAALGYAAVFGSATSTLLAPIFIGGEVFGFAYLPYFSSFVPWPLFSAEDKPSTPCKSISKKKRTILIQPRLPAFTLFIFLPVLHKYLQPC